MFNASDFMKKLESTKIKAVVPFKSLIGEEITIIDYVHMGGTLCPDGENFINSIFVRILFYKNDNKDEIMLTNTSSELIAARLWSSPFFKLPLKVKVIKNNRYYDLKLLENNISL